MGVPVYEGDGQISLQFQQTLVVLQCLFHPSQTFTPYNTIGNQRYLIVRVTGQDRFHEKLESMAEPDTVRAPFDSVFIPLLLLEKMYGIVPGSDQLYDHPPKTPL